MIKLVKDARLTDDTIVDSVQEEALYLLLENLVEYLYLATRSGGSLPGKVITNQVLN